MPFVPLITVIAAAGVSVAVFSSREHPEPPVSVVQQFSDSGRGTIAVPSGKQFEDFRLRPLAVINASAAHEWTAENCKEPNVIRRIAHSEAEVRRLTEENARIRRRQLVYRREPVWVLVERAKAAREPIRRLMLPGMDGQELAMEVTGHDPAPSGLSGTFSGKLAGKGNSMVTVAFEMGREAFTVISPDDGLFLQGQPREPGEVILASFQPEEFSPLPGGEPIKSAP